MDTADQNRVDENRVDENRVDENRVDENRADENRTDQKNRATQTLLDTLRPESLFLVLNGRPFRQSQDERWSIDAVVYRDYDLFICYGGAARFMIGQSEYLLAEGQALLCPPGCPIRASRCGTSNFRAIAQHFTLQISGAADFFDLIEYRPLARLSDWPMIGSWFDRFVDLQDEPRSVLMRNGLFLTVLFAFLRDAWIGERSGMHARFRFVFDMAGTIERCLAADDAVERAMRDVPYSRDYAVRMFRKRFGVPPKEFLLRCRLNAAKDCILGGLSVKETAARTGFADEQYFSRFFARREGISPREYRRRNGF